MRIRRVSDDMVPILLVPYDNLVFGMERERDLSLVQFAGNRSVLLHISGTVEYGRPQGPKPQLTVISGWLDGFSGG